MAALGADSFSAEQRHRLARSAEVTFVRAPRKLSASAFVAALEGMEYAALNPRGTPKLSARVLDRLPSLRGVAIPTTGFEWLDVALLQRRGLTVANVPDYSSSSTAEFTWALILALARKLPLALEAPDAGGALRGILLRGRTLGVVGLGAVGRTVAQIGRGFGMRVLGTDPVAAARRGVRRVELRALLEQGDVVAVHVPLLPSTRGLIGSAELARMKPSALLVNTARPHVVDAAAVSRALKRGALAGYAVDWGYERRAVEKALRGAPNALLLPHIAWYTPEAIARGLDGWVEAIVALARGKPKHLVPPLHGSQGR